MDETPTHFPFKLLGISSLDDVFKSGIRYVGTTHVGKYLNSIILENFDETVVEVTADLHEFSNWSEARWLSFKKLEMWPHHIIKICILEDFGKAISVSSEEIVEASDFVSESTLCIKFSGVTEIRISCGLFPYSLTAFGFPDYIQSKM